MNHDMSTGSPESRLLTVQSYDPRHQFIVLSCLHTVAINEGDTVQWKGGGGETYTVEIIETEWSIWDEENVMLIQASARLLSMY